ncbi:hypothetical protein SLEP1_g49753 [Rubroshorea leprosula]|uniref:Glabrous enhancer-binding protein-like DBD domain-containing protein n=1 Tax=Rubroshorea leprosula TaxID=152421 RepID=A0AAV5M140_9ROSI|nr:hypothetical protein SLEP1_g49753 [Rubroshorea leprosula]
MAPKRPDPKDEPPAASSSEEEETTSGAEEEEETSEEEEETQPTLTQKSPPVKRPEIASPRSASTTVTNAGNQSSESDESESDESGSETDSDSVIPPSVKPIATKPMEESTKSKQPAVKPAASAAKSSAKRPAEPKQPAQKETKRAKKDSENGEEEEKTGDDVKKQLFQRIWSEKDEIAILKGMIEYSAKKGADPLSDMSAFHEFIKDSLQLDCAKGKLSDKIRRLKKKYMGYVKRGKEDGFTKPHEQESFKLSKKIWGDEGKKMGDEVKKIVKAETPVKSKSNVKPKKNQSLAAPKVEVVSSPVASKDKESKIDDILPDKRLGVGSIEEEVLSHGLDVIEGEKKAALKERWRKLRIAELELFLQRSQLVADQAKLMLEHYKSANK